MFHCLDVRLWHWSAPGTNTLRSSDITVSQESQCVRFRRVLTCTPIAYKIPSKQCILTGFVIAVMRYLNWADETG